MRWKRLLLLLCSIGFWLHLSGAQDDAGLVFEAGQRLTIEGLRAMDFPASPITFEEALEHQGRYAQYVVSYLSEGFRVYGLLTIPAGPVPAGGHKAIVFNHGFIPPETYVTTERYVDYVGALAEAGFVVFKIDMRGHGNSEGEASGAYFAPEYTIDAIIAARSLQALDWVDANGVGMWGHSMAGNITLRAMLVDESLAAGVIWAGAVYSYEDLGRYGITDPSATNEVFENSPARRESWRLLDIYGGPSLRVPFWRAVALTTNLGYLSAPLEIHHAIDDPVVSIAYSEELQRALLMNDKAHQLWRYEGGGHNIASPYFEQAMARTIAFYRANL